MAVLGTLLSINGIRKGRMKTEGYIIEGTIICEHAMRPTADLALLEHGIGCVWQCRCGKHFKLVIDDHPGASGVPYWSEYYMVGAYYNK